MEPFHEQGIQELAPPGAIADVENPREAAPNLPVSKTCEELNSYDEEMVKKMCQAVKNVQEQFPLFSEGIDQAITLGVELRTHVLELASIQCYT